MCPGCWAAQGTRSAQGSPQAPGQGVLAQSQASGQRPPHPEIPTARPPRALGQDSAAKGSWEMDDSVRCLAEGSVSGGGATGAGWDPRTESSFSAPPPQRSPWPCYSDEGELRWPVLAALCWRAGMPVQGGGVCAGARTSPGGRVPSCRAGSRPGLLGTPLLGSHWESDGEGGSGTWASRRAAGMWWLGGSCRDKQDPV